MVHGGEPVMRRFLKFLLVIFCCIGCAGETIKTGNLPVPNVPANDPALVPTSRSTRWWVTRHNERINEHIIINQKVIFIGDSITHGYEFAGKDSWDEFNIRYGNRITNLGFSSDSTEHVIWRLENGEFPAGINPEYVVLMIGTNNKGSPGSTAAGIGRILRIINNRSPATRILLFSILPSGEGVEDPDTIRNYEVNNIIKEYDGYLNIRYVDVARHYVNRSGALREELFARDRLHLTSAGYTVWKNRIIETIRRWDRQRLNRQES